MVNVLNVLARAYLPFGRNPFCPSIYFRWLLWVIHQKSRSPSHSDIFNASCQLNGFMIIHIMFADDILYTRRWFSNPLFHTIWSMSGEMSQPLPNKKPKSLWKREIGQLFSRSLGKQIPVNMQCAWVIQFPYWWIQREAATIFADTPQQWQQPQQNSIVLISRSKQLFCRTLIYFSSNSLTPMSTKRLTWQQ